MKLLLRRMALALAAGLVVVGGRSAAGRALIAAMAVVGASARCGQQCGHHAPSDPHRHAGGHHRRQQRRGAEGDPGGATGGRRDQRGRRRTGRPLELVVADDASGAEGAQRAMDQLAPRVDAIIAMETSAARNAALPIVAAHQGPYLYTSFYEGHGCSPWMHVNGWVPEQQVTPVVRCLVQAKGVKTFFLVGSDYAFGRGRLAFTRRFIEQNGGKVVGEDYLPVDAEDWSPVLARLKASRTDALISASARGAPNVALAKQLGGGRAGRQRGRRAGDRRLARSWLQRAAWRGAHAAACRADDAPVPGALGWLDRDPGHLPAGACRGAMPRPVRGQRRRAPAFVGRAAAVSSSATSPGSLMRASSASIASYTSCIGRTPMLASSSA